MITYYLLALLLLFLPAYLFIRHLRRTGKAWRWLQWLPMPIIVIALLWICHQLIFLDRTLGWFWVQAKYCGDAVVKVHRKIPQNALLVLEPAEISADPHYQTLEKWIESIPFGDNSDIEFFVHVASPVVLTRYRFGGNISVPITLTWRGKPATGICLHMRQQNGKSKVLSECQDFLKTTKQPIVRVRYEYAVGIRELNIFNLRRYQLMAFDSNGPFLEVKNYWYGGGWLANTVSPYDDRFSIKMASRTGSYSCVDEKLPEASRGMLAWIKYLSK